VFAECETLAIAEKKHHDWINAGRPKVGHFDYFLPPPEASFSLAQMADWEFPINQVGSPYHIRVDEFGAPLKIPHGYNGAGEDVSYGYLTPREAGEYKIAMRDGSKAAAQTMLDDFKNGLPPDTNLPRWHKPRNEAERVAMQADALAELGKIKSTPTGPIAISDTLARQLAGELPIGESRTGARPVTMAELDAFARDVI